MASHWRIVFDLHFPKVTLANGLKEARVSAGRTVTLRVLVRDSQGLARVLLEEAGRSRQTWNMLWIWNLQDMQMDQMWVEGKGGVEDEKKKTESQGHVARILSPALAYLAP